ncbi:MAG TPA: ROK family protein [Terriglobales bacterium]|nr:ROK family protein [Terriglobales bacterium]
MSTNSALSSSGNAHSEHHVLAIDVGGTNVKLLATGQKEVRKIPSGSTLTAGDMVEKVKEAVKDWKYDAVSIGYPGPVVQGRPIKEPFNLAPGWVKFDFRKAFGMPVKIINDAAMQALGSYKKGRMLFLGLGTGLGSAMIVDGVLQPMELAHLPYKKGRSYEDYLGKRGLERIGKKKWQKNVFYVVAQLKQAVQADDVVLGGGNAKKLDHLPPGARLGSNNNAFLGGFRMWQDEAVRHGIVRTAGWM